MWMMNTFCDHPLYKKICESGIGSEHDWHRTFLVCMDLVECRGWYNVVLHPLEQLQLLLIGGHPSATDDRCFVWPMSTSDSICPSHIQTILSTVKTISDTARLMVGIVSSDSTIVYYTLTDGLVRPEPVDDQHTDKLKRQRKLHRLKTRTVQWDIRPNGKLFSVMQTAMYRAIVRFLSNDLFDPLTIKDLDTEWPFEWLNV